MPSGPRLLRLVVIGVIAVLVAVAAIGIRDALPGSQRYRLRVADRHADQLRPMIEIQPRFQGVSIDSFTGGPGAGGCFSVTGTVPTATDARDLAKIVVDSNPDVPIYWLIGIDEFPFGGSPRVVLERPFKIEAIYAGIEEIRQASQSIKRDP